MSLKWKIFFALNILVALPAFILLVLLLVIAFNDVNSSEDYLYFIIFLFAFSMMMLNGFLNIFLLQRFYPDKLIPAGAKRLNLLSWILTALVTIGLLISCYYAAIEVFDARNAGRNAAGKVTLIILLLILILQLIILVMQLQLRRLISRNNRNSMDSLIDSIGR
ncbi:MAG TPA: hypothetical protein VIZ28_00125 [Chitinophagaceae bacterium]